MEEVRQMAYRFDRLVWENKLDDAQELRLTLIQRMRVLGIESAYVCWVQAVLADKCGDLEKAYQFIKEAEAMDRCAINILQSRRLIIDHLKESLSRAEGVDTDPATPRVWALLSEAGEADVSCHLGYAAWLSRSGQDEAALKLVEAVLLLNPTSAQALLLKSTILRGLCRHQEADEVAAQAATAGTMATPFVIPAQAQG